MMLGKQDHFDHFSICYGKLGYLQKPGEKKKEKEIRGRRKRERGKRKKKQLKRQKENNLKRKEVRESNLLRITY